MDKFLKENPEDGDYNQYWYAELMTYHARISPPRPLSRYSTYTIKQMVEEITRVGMHHDKACLDRARAHFPFPPRWQGWLFIDAIPIFLAGRGSHEAVLCI